MNKKFTITLKENGVHSLEKGLKVFTDFEKVSGQSILLKEAIMFLHHGIELLMKQVLVEKNSEYLIYSDIDSETVKKVISARKQGVSVFNLPKPVHTATYEQVIDRVEAFVDNPAIQENLKTWLVELNRLRNQIEHYAIDKEEKEVKDLIIKIRNPLLKFFEQSLLDFSKKDIEKVTKQWSEVKKFIDTDAIVEKSLINAKGETLIICEGKFDEIVLYTLIARIIDKYNSKRPFRVIPANGLPYFSKTLRNELAHKPNENVVVVTE